MSQAAVMLAVRDQLQATFSLDSNSCEIGFGPEPKPSAGEFYVAVHPLSWGGVSGDYDLGEEYQIGVTLTMRMGVAGRDRWGIAVWLANAEGGDGLEARIRKAIVAIHQSQTVRIAANTHITGGSGNIVTALLLSSVQPPKLQGPSWFSAALPDSEHAVAECGVSQTIVFGKCQRLQYIQDME